MIERSVHDDVTSYRLTWWRSRLVGYAVHVFTVRGALIDTGFPAVRRDVLAVADAERVRGAFVTHQHEDHAGNVAVLAERGVPLAMSAGTAAEVRAPHPIGFYRHFTWQAMPPLRGAIRPFHDDALALVPTPGHSADHCAVWDTNTRTLFAGDLFLGVKVRVAHRHERPREQIASLRATIAREPLRLFCAHRGHVPNAVQMLRAKADWMEETIGAVERLHTAGVAAPEITRRVLGGDGWTARFSAGEYSAGNWVGAVMGGG